MRACLAIAGLKASVATSSTPQAYATIANPEDRLYVPSEYVPLFVEAGWRRG